MEDFDSGIVRICLADAPDEIVEAAKETQQGENPLKDNECKEIKTPKPKQDNLDYTKFNERVQYVFSTVNDNEFNAATTMIIAPVIEDGSDVITTINPGVYIGMMGNHPVGLIQHRSGRDCPKMLQEGIKNFPNAEYLVAVGVCYGFSHSNTKLADVLISKAITDLGSYRKSKDSIEIRGDHTNMKDEIYNIFCVNPSQVTGLEVACDRYANHLVGTIASASILVDDADFKEQIICQVKSKAYGGEMEGGELLRLQKDGIYMPDGSKKFVQVIVIKAVTDYADGTKNKEWQFIGAQAAFHYVKNKMDIQTANKGHRESITSTKSQMVDVQDLRVDSSVNSPGGVEMEHTSSNLQKEVRNLDEEFTDLVVYLLTHLEKTNVTVEQVKKRISIPPEKVWVLISPLWNKLQKKKVEVSDTVTKLFEAMHMELWNFLDYYLLEHLIKKFGSVNLNKIMHEYVDKIEIFKKKTFVVPFFECWDGHKPDIPDDYVDLNVKFNLNNITLADLDKFRRKMEYTCLPFLLDYASGMNYRYLKKGCVQVSWFLPERFSQMFRKNINTLHSLFEEYHVCQVNLRGDSIYSIDCKLMKLEAVFGKKREMSTSESRIKTVIKPFLLEFGKEIKENIFFSATSTLRMEQKEALLKIIDWFSKDDTKNLTSVVIMPAGTGKTGVICCLPYMFGWAVREGKIDHTLSNPILVITPDVTILNQLERNLCYDPENNYKPFLMERKVFNGDEAKFCYRTWVVNSTDSLRRLFTTENRCEVVLCNAQKWRKGKDDIPNYGSLDDNLFSAVIVDEAHHLPAKQWKKIIDKFSSTKVIFFTATPIRHDGREITRELSLTQDYTYVLQHKRAISRRLIRDVTFTALSTDRVGVLLAIQKRLKEKNQDFPLPGNNKHAAIVITKNIIEGREVEETCRKELKWTNIRLVCSDSEKYLKDSKSVINDIKTKGYDLIIIVAMLLEGFDHPPLSVAGILTGIQSRVKFAQFVGHIQRLVRAPTIEDENITGDIITAKQYEQHELFDQYKDPTIVNEE